MDTPVLWTPEQHALIGAMGLSVYAHVDVQSWPAPKAAPPFENLPQQPVEASRPRSHEAVRPLSNAAGPDRSGHVPVARTLPPATQRQAPSADALDTAPTPASARPAPVPRPRGGLLAAMPDRLMLALLRASKSNPADPGTQALMASWPLDALRADPAAKRALWPQLRALRKQRQER